MTGLAAKGMMSVGKGGRGEEATVPEKSLRTWTRRTRGQREKAEERGKQECLSLLERRVEAVVVSEPEEPEPEEGRCGKR